MKNSTSPNASAATAAAVGNLAAASLPLAADGLVSKSLRARRNPRKGTKSGTTGFHSGATCARTFPTVQLQPLLETPPTNYGRFSQEKIHAIPNLKDFLRHHHSVIGKLISELKACSGSRDPYDAMPWM